MCFVLNSNVFPSPPGHRITIPGMPPMHLSEMWNKVEGITYLGDGVAKGQCGVTIHRVKPANHGVILCNLGTPDGDELTGQMPLTVARK